MLGVTRLLGGIRTETDHLRYGPGQESAWHRPVVVWTVTRRCNLACLHCYAGAANATFPGELSTAEARALLRDLADFGVPVLLLGVACKPCLRLNSWDRTLFPLPFARAAQVWEGPVDASRDDDPAELAHEWGARLNAATERAHALLK